MRKTIIAYTAGMVDGEGCIYLRKGYDKNKIHQKYNYAIMTEITNTNLKVLQYI